MYKRKDWNQFQEEEEGSSDSDSEEKAAASDEDVGAEDSGGDNDSDSSDSGGDDDQQVGGRLQDISDEEGDDSDGSDEPEPTGAPFRCALCTKVLLLSDATVLLHTQSKKHAKAAKKANVDVQYPIYSAGARLPLGLEQEEEAETHGERIVRIRQEAADALKPKAAPATKPKASSGTKNGRQRQRERKKKKVEPSEPKKLVAEKVVKVAKAGKVEMENGVKGKIEAKNAKEAKVEKKKPAAAGAAPAPGGSIGPNRKQRRSEAAAAASAKKSS